MKNNIYLYLILISLLVGGFSGFIGYDHFEKAEKYQRSAKTIAQNIESKKEELRKKEIELVDLEFKRREKQATVREFAQAILEQQDVQQEYSKLKDQLDDSVTRQKMIFSVNQKGVSDMQDQLAEDTTSIERQVEGMRATFKQEGERLGVRNAILKEMEEKEIREHDLLLSGLETGLNQTKLELLRFNDLTPTEVKEPWIVGKVLDFYAPLNKVVINLGSTAGIRQNFKFMIFSDRPGQEREYKGMVVIKDVSDLVSTGTMLMAKRESRDPVAGDCIGSFVYQKQGLVFWIYRDKDFISDKGKSENQREKFSVEQLEQYLKYAGNRVIVGTDEENPVDTTVDYFVKSPLVDNLIPDAIKLGVTLIPESLITPYLGE